MVGLIFGKVGIILGKKFSIVPPRVGRAGIRAHPRKTKAGLVEKKKEKKKKKKKKEGIPLTTYFFSHCSASRLLRTRRGFN